MVISPSLPGDPLTLTTRRKHALGGVSIAIPKLQLARGRSEGLALNHGPAGPAGELKRIADPKHEIDAVRRGNLFQQGHPGLKGFYSAPALHP